MEFTEEAIVTRKRLREWIRQIVVKPVTRTDLINIVRARVYGPFDPRRLSANKPQRQKVEEAITRAVAEGDIVEITLPQPGCCKYGPGVEG